MFENAATVEAVSAAIGHLTEAHSDLCRLNRPEDRPDTLARAIRLLGEALDLLLDYEDED